MSKKTFSRSGSSLTSYSELGACGGGTGGGGACGGGPSSGGACGGGPSGYAVEADDVLGILPQSNYKVRVRLIFSLILIV